MKNKLKAIREVLVSRILYLLLWVSVIGIAGSTLVLLYMLVLHFWGYRVLEVLYYGLVVLVVLLFVGVIIYYVVDFFKGAFYDYKDKVRYLNEKDKNKD